MSRPGWLTRILVGGSVLVVGIYVVVALGAAMLLGADGIVESPTVALSVAAEAWLGTAGLVLMTVAAAFATSAAINSTLFSTAQLARRVADDGELPRWFDHRNARDVPDRAVLAIAAAAAVLALVGSLSGLVEAASFVFLVAFAAVNLVAIRHRAGSTAVAGLVLGVGGIVGAILIYRLVTTKPVPLAVIVVLMVASFIGRPWLLRRVETEEPVTAIRS